MVNLELQEVRWECVHPVKRLIGTTRIPEHLRGKKWYPYLGMSGDYCGSVVLL